MELWITRYGHEIAPESHGQAVELLQAWKNYQGPGPEWTDRRKRGLSHPPLPREKKATPMPEPLPTPQLKRKASSTGPAHGDEDKKDPPQRTAQPRHRSLCHAPGPSSSNGTNPPRDPESDSLSVRRRVCPPRRARPMQVARHLDLSRQDDCYRTAHSQGFRRSLAKHLSHPAGEPGPP